MRFHAVLLACAVCAACGGRNSAPLAPSSVAAITAPAPNSGAALAIDWACVQSRNTAGATLGVPVGPACPARTAVAAASVRRDAIAAATAIAPTALISSVSGTTVSLGWTAPAGGVTSYIIEAGSFPTFTDLAVVDTGNPTTSAVFFNVGAGNYFVRVRAKNGTDVSGPSNEVVVTVQGGNCSGTFYGPFAVHASGQGSSLSLTWDQTTLGCPASDYVIEAGSTRGAANLANFRTGSPQARYDATGVGPGTYYVRVRAANNVAVGPAFTETILVVGSACLYAVSPSTISISRGGLAVSPLSIDTGAACSWTVTADAAWLMPPGAALPTSATGPRIVSMSVNVNSGPARTGTVQARWPGGGVDVPASQNGF